MNKYLIYILLMPALFVVSVANSLAMENSRRYPLSMAATQQTVVKWLIKKNYKHLVIPGSNGQTSIQSSDPSMKWSITLNPHSPLATTVSIYPAANEQNDDNLNELLQYFDSQDQTVPPAFDQKPEIPATVLEAIGTVACLRANRQGQTIQFSGVFIDQQGLILSTAHDLNENEEVNIVSTINTLFKGDIIKIDFKRDLALIQIKAEKDQVINIEEGRNLLGMGEKVFSIGCPIGLRGTVNSGFINGPPRLVNQQPLWQASMEIQHGSSGSPVFNGNGDLVAIVKGRHRVSSGIGFLIPLEVIIDFLND